MDCCICCSSSRIKKKIRLRNSSVGAEGRCERRLCKRNMAGKKPYKFNVSCPLPFAEFQNRQLIEYFLILSSFSYQNCYDAALSNGSAQLSVRQANVQIQNQHLWVLITISFGIITYSTIRITYCFTVNLFLVIRFFIYQGRQTELVFREIEQHQTEGSLRDEKEISSRICTDWLHIRLRYLEIRRLHLTLTLKYQALLKLNYHPFSSWQVDND